MNYKFQEQDRRSRNPCGEILLGNWQVMEPRWQVALMSTIGAKAGDHWTRERADRVLLELCEAGGAT